MQYKAIFLDFYGTLVHEDDAVLPLICEQIRQTAQMPCDMEAIGGYWWNSLLALLKQCNGNEFQTQRALCIQSLSQTLEHFGSSEQAEKLIQPQFANWVKPQIYEDTIPFLTEMKDVPAYILSNIDTSDLMDALNYHGIEAAGMITSEDVRSYKPRPEMFTEGLRRWGLKPQDVIHIGDSLLNDVTGAQSLGITAVWLNRNGKQAKADITPDYCCSNLSEVLKIFGYDKSLV